MGFLKKLVYFILILIMLGCGLIFFCAVNPEMGESVRAILYGTDYTDGLLAVDADGNVSLGGNRRGGNVQAEGGEQAADGNGQAENGSGPAQPLQYDVSTGGIVAIPTNVGGLTGYTPVSGLTERVSDTEAKELASELGAGETGNDLDFDALYYPYYQMMNDRQRTIYKQIYANAEAVNTSFVPAAEVSLDELNDAVEAVFADHPELFYVETGYTVKYTQDGKIVEIDLAYYTIANNLASAKEKFYQAAQEILSGAGAFSDDYSRERYAHDTLISRITYSAAAKYDQSAYGALVDGKCVCAGYARAFQYLLQQMNIPCYYCTGTSGEDHAWNIVRLSDGCYNVDVTWDDTSPATYDYFNRSDSDYAGTHLRTGLSVKLPACEGSLYRGLESEAPQAVDIAALVGVLETPGYDPAKDPFINKNPRQPLLYDEDSAGSAGAGEAGARTDGAQTGDVSGNTPPSSSAVTDDELRQMLASLGLLENEVCWTLEEYYRSCLAQMVAKGSGRVSFSNVVPATLYNTIESEYGKGNYQAGYLDSALSSLGMNHCQVTLQAQQLGGGYYYRLYHNMNSWYE